MKLLAKIIIVLLMGVVITVSVPLLVINYLTSIVLDSADCNMRLLSGAYNKLEKNHAKS